MNSKLLFLIVLATNAPANASIITILNPGFEERVISNPGDYTLNDIPDWIATGQAATFKPAAFQLPSGVPEGVNVAAIGNSINGGVVSQTLTATVEANTLYTLNVDVGRRIDYPFSPYMIELIAGDTTLASGSSLTPAPGTFLTDTIVFNSGANPAQFGQNLEIRLSAMINGQAEFDNVRLNATAVPLPPAVMLFAAGLFTLVGTSGLRHFSNA